MIEHEINKLDNFIAGWYNPNTSICDELIEFFKNNPKQAGIVGGGVHKEIKDSTDCVIYDQQMGLKYVEWQKSVLDLYVEKYHYSNQYAPWSMIQPITIQHYTPGSAYFGWHTERTQARQPFSTRHLVYMTYLNDVTDEGETEWFYQKLKIKPEKGLTVIWPADWCFTHRGVASKTQEKYIVTGWFNYIEPEETIAPQIMLEEVKVDS